MTRLFVHTGAVQLARKSENNGQRHAHGERPGVYEIAPRLSRSYAGKAGGKQGLCPVGYETLCYAGACVKQ